MKNTKNIFDAKYFYFIVSVIFLALAISSIFFTEYIKTLFNTTGIGLNQSDSDLVAIQRFSRFPILSLFIGLIIGVIASLCEKYLLKINTNLILENIISQKSKINLKKNIILNLRIYWPFLLSIFGTIFFLYLLKMALLPGLIAVFVGSSIYYPEIRKIKRKLPLI
jgi:hypothetical protein